MPIIVFAPNLKAGQRVHILPGADDMPSVKEEKKKRVEDLEFWDGLAKGNTTQQD